MLRCCYRNHAKDGNHRRDGTHRRYRIGVRKKKKERHDLAVLLHPHRRDGTVCDPSDVNSRLGATATGQVWAVRGTVCSRFLWYAVSYLSSGRHSSHVPFLYRRSSRVETSQVVFHFIGMAIVLYALNQGYNTHTIRQRTYRRDGTWGALKKLEPNDFIVLFPHRYRSGDTHRRDRTGDAWKRDGNLILKRHRTRCHPSHDYGNTVQAFVGGLPVGCEFDPNS